MRNLSNDLQLRREQSMYRQRLINESPAGVEVTVDGKNFISFCSNDYLGLANDQALRDACKAGIDQYGVGSGASQLISGYQTPHHDLECALADFLRRPRALLFSTGYMANLGVVSALMKKGDHVFEDRLNHASLIDGARLCDADLHRYSHNSSESLLTLQNNFSANESLTISDAVFSMDGDLADIPGLVKCSSTNNSTLMIDDAHGIGVLGKQGRGTLSHFNIDDVQANKQVPILVGTFGKAFGTFGAFVAGSEELIETLVQSARSLIYTTAPPAAIAVATLESLNLIRSQNWRREQLHARIVQLQSGLSQLGIKHNGNISAIQPVITGSAAAATRLSEQLRQRGIIISAIRPPTVPENTSRLRITLSALHTEQHIEQLLSALDELDVASGQVVEV